MGLLQSKQIRRLLSSYVRANAFTASGTSNDVTAAITAVLSTASDTGGSVPLLPSTDNQTEGVKTSGTRILPIYDATTGLKINDGNGDEIYGKLTEAAGTYTLSYFVAPSGVETAHDFTPSEDIDFEFIYNFQFKDVPADFATAITARNIQDDPSVGAGIPVREVVAVTALNTLAALSQTPNSQPIFLHVNGKTEDNIAGGAFTNAGTVITWNPVTSEYDLATTDRVIAEYFTF